jgi:hypothetical protein
MTKELYTQVRTLRPFVQKTREGKNRLTSGLLITRICGGCYRASKLVRMFRVWTSEESTMRISAMYFVSVCLMLLIASPVASSAVQPDSPAAVRSIQKNLQAQRIDLHRKAVADADQLQLLATQLKNEMDKSSPGTLPADVVKRTQEIEKLARKVRGEIQQ